MARYELIVFDWDGTLMDSAALIVHAIQAAASDLGLLPPSDEKARHIIGLGLRDALRHAVPELPPERYPAMAARYRHHYLDGDEGLALFPGAGNLVRALHARGRNLAVATGKSRAGLDRALQSSGLGAYFHATRCADECESKPHPQMLEELLAELGMEAERTLMIGDTTHDLLMARNAGVKALAVSYGAHPEEHLRNAEPLHCAGSVEELAAWLEANA